MFAVWYGFSQFALFLCNSVRRNFIPFASIWFNGAIEFDPFPFDSTQFDLF